MIGIYCTDWECGLRTTEPLITNIKPRTRLNRTLYLSDNTKQIADLFQFFFFFFFFGGGGACNLLNCNKKLNEDDECAVSICI